MKNILTIGAYERDNFGDILFYLIFKMALKNHNYNIVPGSIISSDMSKYFGEYVFPYDFMLTQYKWDAVCVLGGEIGGVDLDLALSMSLSKEDFLAYKRLSNKDKMQNYFCGELGPQLAYLPYLLNYEKNKKTKLIINSVGGFESLSLVEDKILIKKAIGSLMDSKLLSVRSNVSSKYLESIGIKNTLIPDVVHSLPFFYTPNAIEEENYFLFQANESFIDINSVDKVSKILKEISDKFDLKICLFVAGSANEHDSLEKYLEIKSYLNFNFKKEVIIIQDTDSLKLVDWIASAKLWIGTSLHGRILSMNFNVRRIGLENKKLSNYSKFWDEDFPSDVKIDELIISCEKALAVKEELLKDKSANLSERAKNNLNKIIEFI